MSALDNKAFVEGLFTARSNGDPNAFTAAMADDFVWRITGSSAWSGEYNGKAAVLEHLLAPLYSQFVAVPRIIPDHILADGDHVVVQCHGEASTVSGERYANTYCLVLRVSEGRLREMTEYMDTALVDRVLQPPPPRE